MKHAARIVGAGALSGAGAGTAAVWRAMAAASPGLRPQALPDTRLAEARYVPVPERPRGEEPASVWLTRVCREALAEAEPVLQSLVEPRIALLCGSSLGGMTVFERAHRRWWDASGAAGPGMLAEDLPLARARYDGPTAHAGAALGVTSGAWTLNTACSSAANALGLARLWLARRRIDAAVVAGVDVVSPFVYAGFGCLNAMDPEPCTPFGAARRGLNLGDAAVALVLVRAEDAPGRRDVDIVGYGSSCDAHHLTRPDPGGKGLVRAVQAALADAEVPAAAVGLISAHGTGTPFNDRMEAQAFATLFGDACPPLHCAKPVAGHTLGASGIIDALLVRHALLDSMLPPTFRRGEADAELPVRAAAVASALAADAVALSTSSGFGGSNAALLMRRAS